MFTVSTLTAVLNRLLPEPHAGLLAGLLFGTKATLSVPLYEDLVASGTLHIIALSGMNISIVSTLFAGGLLWLVSKRIASLLTLVGILWFVWFVGPSPSIVRAAIMGSLSLLATIMGRQNWGIWSWLLAVSTMILLNPAWLADLSFQLSALASLGIILFGSGTAATAMKPYNPSRPSLYVPRIAASILGQMWKLIRNNLRLTMAAQVFTIPLILLHFHRISLISPVSNLLIGWLISPLTIFGWVTAVAGWVWLPLGRLVGLVDWVLLQYLLLVVRWTGNIPWASVGG